MVSALLECVRIQEINDSFCGGGILVSEVLDTPAHKTTNVLHENRLKTQRTMIVEELEYK